MANLFNIPNFEIFGCYRRLALRSYCTLLHILKQLEAESTWKEADAVTKFRILMVRVTLPVPEALMFAVLCAVANLQRK